ncbi:MAG: hypothetical protein LBP69_09625 [Treponema sp.]|jgi:hypothetical protein|nr:hypothetical protein [Treponema sp.]
MTGRAGSGEKYAYLYGYAQAALESHAGNIDSAMGDFKARGGGDARECLRLVRGELGHMLDELQFLAEKEEEFFGEGGG